MSTVSTTPPVLDAADPDASVEAMPINPSRGLPAADDDDDGFQQAAAERKPLTEVGDATENSDNAKEGITTDTKDDGSSCDKKKKMETFEIEDADAAMEDGPPSLLHQISQDVDDLDEEAQGLLSDPTTAESSGGGKKIFCFYCIGPLERLGSCTIFAPSCFARSGWGIMGPHWFGPPCVLGVLLSASFYFIEHAFHKIGPITGGICVMWTGMIVYLLLNAAYRDPGIVRQGQETPTKNHRWCELCKEYQPPKGAHCPDCNVCVACFDHHCVWMGCCIGKSNFKQFTLFNISWLLFLGYCIFWVSLLGPLIFHHHKKH